MASIVDKLRAVLGGKTRAEQPQAASAFHALSREYLACENEAQKTMLFHQMCRALPDTLFLCSVCFEGDNPNAAANDKQLHATVGAEKLYEAQKGIVTRGNPGYRLKDKKDKRRMHLRTLVYQKTKEEWVPLFTDFNEYLPVFGQKSSVALISFREAQQMARAGKGLIINPGKNAIRLDHADLKKVL